MRGARVPAFRVRSLMMSDGQGSALATGEPAAVPATRRGSDRTGNIDGFYGGEPGGQRAVYEGAGYVHTLSRDLWQGHPCCAFGVSGAFIKENPNSFAALYRAVLNAATMARDPRHREFVANAIAPANYLNQPPAVLEQVLIGKYADGLGNIKNDPKRVDFDPFPWQSMAVWMLTQMKRWGYIKGDVNYKQIAEQVFLATDAKKRMADLGITHASGINLYITPVTKDGTPLTPLANGQAVSLIIIEQYRSAAEEACKRFRSHRFLCCKQGSFYSTVQFLHQVETRRR